MKMVSSPGRSLLVSLCSLVFAGLSSLSEGSYATQKILRTTKYNISTFDKKLGDDESATDLNKSRSRVQRGDWSTRNLVNFDEVYEGSDIAIKDMQYTHETALFGSTLSESVEVTDSTIFNIKSSSFSINFDAEIRVTNVNKDTDDLIFRLGNVKMKVPLPAPLNEDLFLSIINRSLLRPDDIFPCLFNAEMEAAVAAAAVAINTSTYSDLIASLSYGGNMMQTKSMPNMVYADSNSFQLSTIPTVYDYTIADTTEEGLSKSIQTLFASSILSSMPDYNASLSELLIRSALENEIFVNHIMKLLAADAVRCPTSYIDFREFFLSSQESYRLGGSGLNPYGNIGVFANSLIQEQLKQVDDTGSVALNSFLESKIDIDAAMLQIDAKEQINSALKSAGGMIPIDFLDGFKVNKLKLGISNVRLQNLNTISAPLKLLEPISQPHILENKVAFGPMPGKRISAKMDLKIDIDAGPVTTTNEISFGFFVDSIDTEMDLLAMIESEDLINMGFNDIINPFCWLSLVPKPGFNELDALQQDNTTRRHFFGIERFKSEIDGFAATVRCIECDSEALEENLSMVNGFLSNPLLTDKIKPEMENFIQNLMLGECVQNSFDQILILSPRLCGNNPEYDVNFTPDQLISMVVPSDPLSCVGVAPTFENIQNFALWGSTLVHAGFSIFAKAIAGMDGEDDMSSYSTSETMDSDLFFDFTSNSGDLLHTGIQLGSNIINNWLGYSSSRNDGISTLGVNRLMEKYFLDDKVLRVSFGNDVQFKADTWKVELSEVRVVGLTSFNKFEILKIIGPQKVENQLELGELLIQLDIKVIPIKQGKVDDEKEPYTLTYEIEMKNVAISVAMVLEIYEEKLTFDNFNMDNLLPCIASMLHRLEFTELKLTAGAFELLGVKGYPSAQIVSDAVFIKFGIDTFLGTGKESLPIITNVILRNFINNFLADYQKGNPTCPKPPMMSKRSRKQEVENKFLDFREIFSPSEEIGGNIMDMDIGGIINILVDIFLNDWMAINTDTNLAAINSIIFGHPGSSEYFNDLTLADVFNFEQEFSSEWLNGSFGLGISDLSVRNLDTLGSPLSLMEVTVDEPSYLNNSMAIGVGDNAMELSFIIDFKASFYDGTNFDINPMIANKFEFRLAIDDLAIVVNGIYEILQSRADSFSPFDITNYNCLLSLFEAPEVSSRGLRVNTTDPSIVATLLAISMGKVDVSVSCIECTSPLLKDLEETLSLPESPAQITDALNGLMKFVIEKAENGIIDDFIARLLVDSSKQCTSSSNYDPKFTGTKYKRLLRTNFDLEYPGLVILTVAVMILLCVGGAFGIMMRCITRRRHNRWSLTLSATERSFLIKEQEMKNKTEAYVNQTTTSMIRNKSIPWAIRYFMPVIVIINIALFLSGHLDSAGGVGITLNIGGNVQDIREVKTLSIVETTQLMWAFDLYVPTILVFLLSIVWPYLKQTITLLIWILPPTIFPTSTRGSVLYWLDTLGKWSIVDVFIMITLITGLRTSISIPSVDFLPENLYKIDLYVTPMWGMYSNMIAQILSQICSHFFIHYHRKIINIAEGQIVVAKRINSTVYEPSLNETTCPKSESSLENIEQIYSKTSSNLEIDINDKKHTSIEIYENDDVVRLCRYNFSRTYRNNEKENEVLVMKKSIVNSTIVVAAIAIFVLNVLFFSVPSVYLDSLGIVGLITEFGRSSGSSIDAISVSRFLWILYEQTTYFKHWYESFGLLCFATLFVWSVILVPLLLTLLMLRLWFIPLTRKERKRMQVVVEILVAWEYSEVFLFSLAILVWQTEQVTSGWVRSLCRPLNDYFRIAAYYGVIDAKDAQCYTRIGNVGNGQFIILALVVILYLLTVFVTKATSQYLRETEGVLSYRGSFGKVDETESGSYDSEVDISCNEKCHNIEKIKVLPMQFTDTFQFLFDVKSYCDSRNV